MHPDTKSKSCCTCSARLTALTVPTGHPRISKVCYLNKHIRPKISFPPCTYRTSIRSSSIILHSVNSQDGTKPSQCCRHRVKHNPAGSSPGCGKITSAQEEQNENALPLLARLVADCFGFRSSPISTPPPSCVFSVGDSPQLIRPKSPV